MGLDLNVIEDQEPDAALGNGGLWTSGSMLPGFSGNTGICRLRMWYPLPLWYVQAEDQRRYQVEVPDNWLKDGNPFELRRPEYAKKYNSAVMFV